MNGPRLAFLALAHVLPGAAFALPPDTLTVVVFDATPCRPVPGATVTVGCASRRTGVGGACRAGRTRAAERVAIQPPHAATGRRIRRRQDEARTLERFAGVQPRGSPRRSGLLDFDCI